MLKRIAPLFALAALLALPLAPLRAAEPANLGIAKDAVNRYLASGEYGRQLTKVSVKAGKYLAKRVAKPLKEGEKRAIVLDIDETALTNLTHITAYDFGYVPDLWTRWVASGQARAIIPIQLVYDVAVQNNIAVFFITGRTPADAPGTEKNLRETGYGTWEKSTISRIPPAPPGPSRPASANSLPPKATPSSSTSATRRATSPAASPSAPTSSPIRST